MEQILWAMDGDTADVLAPYLDLTRMQAGTDDAEIAHGVPKGGGAADGPSGTVEGGQDAVAGELHHSASEALDVATGHLVVLVEEVLPAPIAQLTGPLRRRDDVGEQDRGENPVVLDAPANARQELLDLADHRLGFLGL